MFHCTSANHVNINIHNFTYKYWINSLLFWFGSNTRLPSFKFIAPAVLQWNKCQKIKQTLPNVSLIISVPNSSCLKNSWIQSIFNCQLNNKTKHTPVYEIWTLRGVELRSQDGYKVNRKEKLRGGVLIGWASLIAQLVKNLPAMKKTLVRFLGWERSAREGIGCPLQYSWASLVAQLVKNPPAVQETWVRSLGWKRSPEEGKGYPFQYSGLKNSTDCIVHRVTKSLLNITV